MRAASERIAGCAAPSDGASPIAPSKTPPQSRRTPATRLAERSGSMHVSAGPAAAAARNSTTAAGHTPWRNPAPPAGGPWLSRSAARRTRCRRRDRDPDAVSETRSDAPRREGDARERKKAYETSAADVDASRSGETPERSISPRRGLPRNPGRSWPARANGWRPPPLHVDRSDVTRLCGRLLRKGTSWIQSGKNPRWRQRRSRARPTSPSPRAVAFSIPARGRTRWRGRRTPASRDGRLSLAERACDQGEDPASGGRCDERVEGGGGQGRKANTFVCG